MVVTSQTYPWLRVPTLSLQMKYLHDVPLCNPWTGSQSTVLWKCKKYFVPWNFQIYLENFVKQYIRSFLVKKIYSFPPNISTFVNSRINIFILTGIWIDLRSTLKENDFIDSRPLSLTGVADCLNVANLLRITQLVLFSREIWPILKKCC